MEIIQKRVVSKKSKPGWGAFQSADGSPVTTTFVSLQTIIDKTHTKPDDWIGAIYPRGTCYANGKPMRDDELIYPPDLHSILKDEYESLGHEIEPTVWQAIQAALGTQ